MREGGARSGWYDTEPRGELVRYALCAMAVAAVAAAGATAMIRTPVASAASETQNAVLVDLPPALASASPRSEAPDGPEQAASEIAPAAPPAPPPPPPVATPAETPPEALHPDAVVEKKEDVPPPPPPPVAAAPAVEEQAPKGADAKEAVAEDEAPSPAPDAHALAAWQRAMVERLERAKGRSGTHSHMVGTVVVAFRIDRRGRLVEEHVERTSMAAGLDAAALSLLAAAAPFPVPPPGVGDAGLTFTVPVRFNPRR